jgi:signal transduction histidine kinase
MLTAKVRPLAREAGVRFEVRLSGDGNVPNREANLINLVLYNLVQNAIQATPRDKSVMLTVQAREQQIVCEVRDEGCGFNESQRANLFKPCRSSKEGGSGIGLAISKQLAKSIGASLELAETSPDGSRFVLAFNNRMAADLEPTGQPAPASPPAEHPAKAS